MDLWLQDSVASNLGNLGESWGICSVRPRLPGRGFDYTEPELTDAAAAGLDQLPGCSFVGLQMVGNIAKRYIIITLVTLNEVSIPLHGMLTRHLYARFGGAILQDSCSDSKHCGFIGISSSAGASTLLLEANVAGFWPSL